MRKIGNREIYAGVILFSSSLLLLTLVIFSFISDMNTSQSLSTNEFFKRFFGLALTVLGVKGGMQLLMRKTSGWVISLSMLFFFVGVVAYGFIGGFFTGVEIATGLFIALLLSIGIGFLLSGRSRAKFEVGQKNITPVILLTASLALLYIYMQ